MLFSVNTNEPSNMDAIVIDNILYIDSDDHGDQTTLTFYPTESSARKKILVTGERGKVKTFFDTLAFSQYRVVTIPKHLKMEVRDV